MEKNNKMKSATKAIHAGQNPDSVTGAIMPPIYMTSTFVQDAPGHPHAQYDYTRAGNPNFTNLENQLAALENGKYGTVCSSGLGALSAMACTLKPGDRVVAMDGVYGGTYRFFSKVFYQYGVKFEMIAPKSIDCLDRELQKGAKWLLIESPTNPLLDIYDIREFAAVAKKYGILTIVDNTFATPYFQNPLDLGADIVWHSTTKYIGGHSDVIGGVLITNDQKLHEQFVFNRMAIGVNPSPFDVWLTSRGVKTLALRMEQHQKNAFAVAQFFKGHPKVKRVYYPGLESHPGHEIARKQMSGFSGMVSAEFDLPLEQMKEMISSYQYFALAESLGGVESLVNHPASMTHASMPEVERLRIGLTNALVRFSVGIEDVDDLIEDLERGF